jgi:predicted ATPase
VAQSEHVASTVARALDVRPVAGETSAEALQRFLAPKHLLLAIDNFEHVLEASALVTDLLSACPRLTVLATSREALDVTAEHRFAVAPLEVPARPDAATEAEVELTAATAMFLAAARRYDSAFTLDAANAPAVAAICAKLDGLPLALELAAAQTRFFGPERLADRLDHVPAALGTGPRDLPDRQRTLRATLDWSHRLLGDEQRAAFAGFGVFAGGATLDAAEAVTASGVDVLEALVDKHLLQLRERSGDEPRLHMLETVRAYAAEQLAGLPERDAVHRRHAEWYLALVERAAPALYAHGEADAVRVLDREVDNLRAALAWALTSAPGLALRLAGLLRRYWRIRRAASEGLEVLDAVLRGAGEAAPLRDRAEAELGRPDLLFLLGDPDAALGAARRALELYIRAADAAGIADAMCQVAYFRLIAGDGASARTDAEAAYRHARAVGHEPSMARALAVLAPALPADESPPVRERAAALLRRLGNRRELVSLYANCSYSALREGRFEEALSLQDQSEAADALIGDPMNSVLNLSHLGMACLLSGDFPRARRAFTRQVRLCGEHGFRWQAAESLAGLAALAARDEELERAARLFGAVDVLREHTDREVVTRLERDFIAPARDRGDAASWLRAARAGAEMPFQDLIAYAVTPGAPLSVAVD